MKTNNYLYGDDVEVPEIPADVIMRRVELLKDNLEELYDVPMESRDNYRIRAVTKARDFWRDINKKEI